MNILRQTPFGRYNYHFPHLYSNLLRRSPKSDRQLNANGWILINTATRAERTENEIFASLQTIASRIANLAIDLDENLREGQWSVSPVYPSRLSLIITPRITNEVNVLSPLYIGRRHFLSPLAFVTLLGPEYQAVHDQPPCQGEDGLWRLPRTAFTDNLHIAFEKYLQRALCSTEEVGATCSISDADVTTKVLEINRHTKLNAIYRIHG